MYTAPMSFQLKWVPHGSDEYGCAVQLRREVLRLPLGLDFSDEELAAEWDQQHLVALLNDEVVACLALAQLDAALKMRQVAVATEWQGSGFGRDLVVESERFARGRGVERVVLHARAHVVAFYEKLGYQVQGEEFMEVGIPHWSMHKSL